MIYKVNVYKLENKINKSIFLSPTAKDERRKYQYLDQILLEKTKEENYREIFTETEIDLFSKENIDKKGLIIDKYINYRKLREEGVQIFAFKEDINEENNVDSKNINEYFKTFFDSDYKKTIDNIQIEKAKQKVKETKKSI